MTVYKKSCYTTVDTFSSIKQLIAAYITTLSDRQAVSNFYSSLLKYAMPALGFPAPKENRLDSIARDKYLDVLNSLSLMELTDLPIRLEEYFPKIKLSKSACRPIRSRINKFYDYFAENVLEPEEQLVKRSSSGEVRFYRKNYGHSLRKIRTTDRTRIIHVDYDALDPKLYAKLKKEILKVEEFAENFLKLKRTDKRFIVIEKLVTLVGWFHQVHGRDLSLSSIMKYISLKATSKTKLNGKSVIEYETNQLILCREHSHEVIKDLECFFNSCGHELKPGTKSGYIRSLKILAKYLYQNDTDICFYNTYHSRNKD
ncbi:MAG: hypothetical protein QNJ55_12995 [Xenococcus sp. MO_188.B8]|nr:hypothetical protein [Xenococcus sp. MO_188.B8]